MADVLIVSIGSLSHVPIKPRAAVPTAMETARHLREQIEGAKGRIVAYVLTPKIV